MPISEMELDQARTAWGDALIAISKTYEADGIDGARALAESVLDTAYGYNLGPVLFKPTLASGEKTFRPTRKGALSYFVGHDAEYPLDIGFGIRGWRKFEAVTAASFIDGDVAMWMGSATFTDKDGQVTKAEKSWGYKKCEDGVLRIVLHHSSLPYQP
ncbi:MAG: phosphoribosyl-AMP cyclohydrolase [Neomegalonema sp.]|nr:phosphoribosyl-AMP cyclohydrolase [Neomegalonema sp.]